jgi:hypothetical protein
MLPFRLHAAALVPTLAVALAGAGCKEKPRPTAPPPATGEAPSAPAQPDKPVEKTVEKAVETSAPPSPAVAPAPINKDVGVRSYEERLAAYYATSEARKRGTDEVCSSLAATIADGKPFVVRPIPGAGFLKDETSISAAAERSQYALCVAVERRSDAPCDHTGDAPRCRVRRALVEQARGKAGAAALLADAVVGLCEKTTPNGPCAALRDALREANPAECPNDHLGQAACAAWRYRDPARCPAGTDETAKGCQAEARFAQRLAAGGIKALASGDAGERALVAAAAGAPHACEPLAAALHKACVDQILRGINAEKSPPPQPPAVPVGRKR